MILALGLLDREIVDAGEAPAHESLLVESPILVAVAAEPASTVVMPFVSKPDRDAVVTKGPDFLDQTVVQLLIPYSTCVSGKPLWQHGLEKTPIDCARHCRVNTRARRGLDHVYSKRLPPFALSALRSPL